MLTGLLLVRTMFLEVECFKLCFSLRGIVLCDVAGLKCLATLSEGMTPEAYGSIRLTLGELCHDKVEFKRSGRIRGLGVTGFGDQSAGRAVSSVGGELCGRGCGDGGIGLDSLGGRGECFTPCFWGLQVKIHLLVALDGEVVFDGFVRAVVAADRDQSDQDWVDVDLAFAKQVDRAANALHVRLGRFPGLHLHIGERAEVFHQCKFSCGGVDLAQ